MIFLPGRWAGVPEGTAVLERAMFRRFEKGRKGYRRERNGRRRAKQLGDLVVPISLTLTGANRQLRSLGSSAENLCSAKYIRCMYTRVGGGGSPIRLGSSELRAHRQARRNQTRVLIVVFTMREE